MYLDAIWIRTLALTFLSLSASATHAQPAKEKPAVAKADKPTYKTPQEVGDAFIAATAKKDWKGSFRCFAPESQDMVVVHVITMMRFGSINQDKETKALEQVFKRHNFDPDKAAMKVENLAKAADKDNKKPDWHKAVKIYAESIKDKQAFFADVLKWADDNYASGTDVRPTKVQLKDVVIKNDTANAKLSTGSGEGWKVSFKKVDGVWFLIEPEEEYEPSGWNDGFLFDYLDDIHHWRF